MRGWRLWTVTLFALGLLVVAGAATAEVAVPPLRARVTDLTNTLGRDQQNAIEQRLAQFEARKGAQIAVLILPSTKPETIEQFAVRVQEQWKLGRKGVDDGVLLVVAKDDRALRIEVGYGLEGVLPDAIAKRIIEEDITPQFRRGDFYAGINDGVTRIIQVIDGEPLPPPKQSVMSKARVNLDWLFPVFVMVMIGRRLLPSRRTARSKVRLTETEWTAITTSPGPGTGSGTCSRARTSGPPKAWMTTAFMAGLSGQRERGAMVGAAIRACQTGAPPFRAPGKCSRLAS